MSPKPVLICIALSATAASCAHVAQPPPAPPPDPTRGGVALRFIVDPKAEPPKLTEHQEFLAPKIHGAPAMPAYPRDALAAKSGGTVVVRITIDTEGAVALVEDSPVMASTEGPFATAFRAAADKAIRSWRFSPGEIQQLEDGKDLDGDGKPDYTVLVRSDRVPVIYDVRFDFYLVKGAGKVRSSVQ